MEKWLCTLAALVMLDPSFWRNRRVLVTGHTGFKGSWLVLWLLSLGADVWGFALPPEGERSLYMELELDNIEGFSHWGCLHHHHGDICDLEALKNYVSLSKPEVVIHLAAQPLVRRSYEDPLGTWSTNVLGSLQLLEALKSLNDYCAVVMVTTDKVYENREWDYGYRENDPLGGHDPYSASKAAAELAIASWRNSFCGPDSHQTQHLGIASSRAGNVIGGGDWAKNRILPDAMRALGAGKPILVRSPQATRPWQHVLEPLGGYLLLAEKLTMNVGLINTFTSAFNFGPTIEANRKVSDLVDEVLLHRPGTWRDLSDSDAPHEAGRLHLQIDKACHQLGWQPRWDFSTTVARTVDWYRAVDEGASPLACCLADLKLYCGDSTDAH